MFANIPPTMTPTHTYLLLKNHIEALDAIASAKNVTIQALASGDGPDRGWEDWPHLGYNVHDGPPRFWLRIKPAPQYRPFTLEDVRGRPIIGLLVKHKVFDDGRFMIFGTQQDGVSFGAGMGTFLTWQRAFRDIEFADGSPFGVKQ